MRKNRWLQLGIILFIAVNLFLVLQDDEMKIDRISYVNDWSASFTADLKNEMYKPVVLSAANEEQIYFDRSKGIFQEFLVSEGDEVTEGTGLYTYRVENYYETEADFLQQIERVNGEIEALESAISQIENYAIPSNEFNPSSSVLITEEDIFVEIPESQLEAEFMKEQYLVEKEHELTAKNLELTSLENQLSELRSTGDMLTVESPYAGIIKHISTELADPLIIIESVELQASGNLTEVERTEVKEGMPAVLQLEKSAVMLEGVVDSLAHSPASLEVDEESNYKFTATFTEGLEDEETDEDTDTNEDEETDEDTDTNEDKETDEDTETDVELLPGYHGTLMITLEESIGAVAIFENAFIDHGVWQMNNDGTLQRREIETGLFDDHQVEIINGLESGVNVAAGPVKQLRNGATFITPIQWRELNRGSLSPDRPEWKSFVSGILSR
ncbi:efflux RND transporter periplasmic adaptor subunit [Oceanobacillus luteolus]|uniref:Efflux RND transporter periplasmic adaptor subunit n=1 Tax=Oceanobacillus luteolus TaxID=1274358 RepID=A0ABW4HUL3_9BACI